MDSEPHSKRLCVDIGGKLSGVFLRISVTILLVYVTAPDEAQAVEIMCSFYNPRAIHEGIRQ